VADLVLLSGLPGIGKTSVATGLCEDYPSEFGRIHFGGLIRRSIEETHVAFRDHEDFRSRFAGYLTKEILEQATSLVPGELTTCLARVALLDSHAVTPQPNGALKVSPDSLGRLEQLPYAMILHLSASGVEDRVAANSLTAGRRVLEPSVVVAETAQIAVAVGYAAATDCPLYVVDARGSLEDVKRRVRDIVTAASEL
jgi:adenylate kinase